MFIRFFFIIALTTIIAWVAGKWSVGGISVSSSDHSNSVQQNQTVSRVLLPETLVDHNARRIAAAFGNTRPAKNALQQGIQDGSMSEKEILETLVAIVLIEPEWMDSFLAEFPTYANLKFIDSTLNQLKKHKPKAVWNLVSISTATRSILHSFDTKKKEKPLYSGSKKHPLYDHFSNTNDRELSILLDPRMGFPDSEISAIAGVRSPGSIDSARLVLDSWIGGRWADADSLLVFNAWSKIVSDAPEQSAALRQSLPSEQAALLDKLDAYHLHINPTESSEPPSPELLASFSEEAQGWIFEKYRNAGQILPLSAFTPEGLESPSELVIIAPVWNFLGGDIAQGRADMSTLISSGIDTTKLNEALFFAAEQEWTQHHNAEYALSWANSITDGRGRARIVDFILKGLTKTAPLTAQPFIEDLPDGDLKQELIKLSEKSKP